MLTVQALDTLIGQVLGLRIRHQDREHLLRWIADRASRRQMSIADWAIQLTETSFAAREEREAMTVRLTTGETYFMRDVGLFELLAGRLLPEIIERRQAQRRIRIWSAGCASGEEAYSLAMLIRESSHSLDGWDIQILGSDIYSEALLAADRGVYGEWSFRALDATRKKRYFQAHGRHWVLTDELRPLVRFIHSDLIADSFPDSTSGLQNIDLILCRNVFIYMRPEAVAEVSVKLAATLTEGGYLITGHGELLGHNSHGLHTRVFPTSVVFHKQSEWAGLVEKSQDSPFDVGEPRQKVFGPLREYAPAHLPVLDPEPNFSQCLQRAWRHANRGEREEANEACRTTSKLNPLDPWPYYIQAQLANEIGDIRQARKMLERVIYLDASVVAAYVELAGLFEQEDRLGAARRMLINACRELRRLPADAIVPPYEATAAGELLCYLEARLKDLPVEWPNNDQLPGTRPAAV
jgi:chemotaxis protein methyltransferase CheR